MVDVRQEMHHIDKQHERHHKRAGEHVTWFEYINPTTGDVHPVYDTGMPGAGGRTFKAGVVLPALWVTEYEDQRTPRPEGRQTTQRCELVLSYKAVERAGIAQPWESTVHVRDMVYIDGRYYKVFEFVIHRGMQDEVTIHVEGEETYVDEELVNDPGPAATGTTDWRFPATFPPLP